jgi:hypothetical protein
MKIKCKSGLAGWRNRLQKNYSSFGEFEYYCELYGLHIRLGFDTPQDAWNANPIVEGSVNPFDFRNVSA